MSIIATDVGLQASANAEAGGILVKISSFAVTESPNPVLDPADTALVGTPVFSGSIESVEALSSSTVKFTISIPKGFPSTGNWSLTELGLYTDNGVLFARGTLPNFPKTSAYGLKFFVFVSAARLGTTINITVSDTYSLPSAAAIDNLLSPADSNQNVIVVLDESSQLEEYENTGDVASSSAGIAVKTGPGGLQWSFLGHERVFKGKADQTFVTSSLTLTSFVLDPNSKGFWLNDGEVVIAQVAGGSNFGESRKLKYTKATNRFDVLRKPFKVLNSNTVLSIWRSSSASLPLRSTTLPDFLVLGKGRNDFVRTQSANGAGKLVALSYAITGNDGSTYTIPELSIPSAVLAIEANLLVTRSELGIFNTSFNTAGNTITFSTPLLTGQSATVRAFQFVSSQEEGGEFLFQEAKYTATGNAMYQLPAIPDTEEYVWAYNATTSKFYDQSKYTLSASRLTFTTGNIPASGDELYFITFAHAPDGYSRSKLVRNGFETTASTIAFASSALITDFKKLQLFIDGKYVPKSLFTVDGNNVILKTAIAGPHTVDLLNFTSDTTEVSAMLSGRDDGPSWIDPAGEEGAPNTLIPVRFEYTGAAGTATYTVAPVSNKDYILAFMDGRRLFASEITYVPNSSIVTLAGSNVLNAKIDIVCFTEVKSTGSSPNVTLVQLTSTGGNSYTIQTGANPLALLVSVAYAYGSLLIHKREYNYDPATGIILFNANIATGLLIEAWSFMSNSAIGFRTRVQIDSFKARNNRTHYALRSKVDFERNILTFGGVNGELIDHSKFSLSTVNNSTALDLTSTFPNNTDVETVSFIASTPQSRLMLRETADNAYLRRDAGLWDVSDVEDARRALGVSNDALNGDYLRRDLNLGDLTNAAQARANLGLDALDATYLRRSQNLADLSNFVTARTNLDVYSKAEAQSLFLDSASNLSDLSNLATARNNLDVYSKAESQTLFLDSASNLSDVANPNTALANLNGVSRAGSLMTGFLTLSGAPTQPLHAATRQFVLDNAYVPPFASSVNSTPNTLALRNGAGDIAANFFFQNAGAELVSTEQVVVTGNGDANRFRKLPVNNFVDQNFFLTNNVDRRDNPTYIAKNIVTPKAWGVVRSNGNKTFTGPNFDYGINYYEYNGDNLLRFYLLPSVVQLNNSSCVLTGASAVSGNDTGFLTFTSFNFAANYVEFRVSSDDGPRGQLPFYSSFILLQRYNA